MLYSSFYIGHFKLVIGNFTLLTFGELIQSKKFSFTAL
jgi:hypothetical protein